MIIKKDNIDNNTVIADKGEWTQNNKGEWFRKTEIGLDGDGNKNYMYKKQDAFWILKDKIFHANGENYTLDEHYLTRLVINRSKFKVCLENINQLDKNLWKAIILKPNECFMLPHSYITPWVEKIGHPAIDRVNLEFVYTIEKIKKFNSLKRGEMVKP